MKPTQKKRPPNTSINLNLNAVCKGAIEAAHAAGGVLLRHFGKRLKVSEKKGAGLVTNADLEAEAKTVLILKRSFPEFGFLTEEGSPIAGTSPGRWIIDPLDGTTNYVHGFPMFCVSIAAEWKGKIVVGVIYHPILNETYVAVLGKGSTLNKKPIHVSKTTKLGDALLTTGFAYTQDKTLKSDVQTFYELSLKARAIRRPGSAALDLAYTARGAFDGFWERNLSAWDVAAGSLLVTEAGGKISDFDGNSFDIQQKRVLASNGFLHSKLMAVVSET